MQHSFGSPLLQRVCCHLAAASFSGSLAAERWAFRLNANKCPQNKEKKLEQVSGLGCSGLQLANSGEARQCNHLMSDEKHPARDHRHGVNVTLDPSCPTAETKRTLSRYLFAWREHSIFFTSLKHDLIRLCVVPPSDAHSLAFVLVLFFCFAKKKKEKILLALMI